jgi:hypothetical protein
MCHVFSFSKLVKDVPCCLRAFEGKDVEYRSVKLGLPSSENREPSAFTLLPRQMPDALKPDEAKVDLKALITFFSTFLYFKTAVKNFCVQKLPSVKFFPRPYLNKF